MSSPRTVDSHCHAPTMGYFTDNVSPRHGCIPCNEPQVLAVRSGPAMHPIYDKPFPSPLVGVSWSSLLFHMDLMHELGFVYANYWSTSRPDHQLQNTPRPSVLFATVDTRSGCQVSVTLPKCTQLGALNIPHGRSGIVSRPF
jgi:hypothetical protein